MKPTLVLLAAGMGSRYGGLKQVDAVGPSGETIMDYSIYDALRAGFGKVIFVIRKDIEADFRLAFTNKLEGKVEFAFAYQELDMLPQGISVPEGRQKPWGTGHAVMVAEKLIQEPFAVINADDFYGFDAYCKLAEELGSIDASTPTYSMVAYDLDKTLSDFGDVSRGICETDEQSFLKTVTERTKIKRMEGRIAFHEADGTQVALADASPVSMNFWGFTPTFFSQLNTLFNTFIREAKDPLKGEFYLSTAIDTLIRQKEASVRVLRTSSRWFGVTYKEDKPFVVDKVNELVAAGAYPVSLWK